MRRRSAIAGAPWTSLLRSFEEGATVDAIPRALETITGMRHPDAAAWRAWWKAHEREYPPQYGEAW